MDSKRPRFHDGAVDFLWKLRLLALQIGVTLLTFKECSCLELKHREEEEISLTVINIILSHRHTLFNFYLEILFMNYIILELERIYTLALSIYKFIDDHLGPYSL